MSPTTENSPLHLLEQHAPGGQIGLILLKSGLLTAPQLSQAVHHHHEHVGADYSQLGETLVELGFITPSGLLEIYHKLLVMERRDYQARFHQKEAIPIQIRFKGLVKRLDGRVVLDGIDLEIPAGKITAIIGISGGGKSVTLKHMIGLMRPDTGEVWVGDQELGALSPRQLNRVRDEFGMLFQGGALFDSLTVFDNVAFPLREKTTLSESEIKTRVENSLRAVHLQGMGGKFPDELSGGMIKRTALARAMVTNPKIILLDEPTAGLDPIIERSIHHLICSTYLRARYTMVMISHAVPEIFSWCHHVVFLHGGKVLASCPAAEIHAMDDPVIKQFINGELHGPITVI